jgi:hypothetical protein
LKELKYKRAENSISSCFFLRARALLIKEKKAFMREPGKERIHKK